MDGMMFAEAAEHVKVGPSMIYFDHNAGAPLTEEAGRAIAEAIARGIANPSSLHGAGRGARQALEAARAEVAALVGAQAEEIVFTSGATESNQRAIAAALSIEAGARQRVVSSKMEHPSVLVALEAATRGAPDRVTWLSPDRFGRLDGAVARQALDDRCALVAVQLVNHELGVVHPVAEIAGRATKLGAWMHCDAAQGVGKIGVDAAALGVDTLSVTAAKIGGPAGVGALYVRRARQAELARHGLGGQERGMRAGTQNLLGAIGFGAAARRARVELDRAQQHVLALRVRLEAGLVALGGDVRGAGDEGVRAPGTVSVRFDGVDGQILMEALDLEGVCVSNGAACSSGSTKPSEGLLALGLSTRQVKEVVRLSLGPSNTLDEVARVLTIFPSLLARMPRQ